MIQITFQAALDPFHTVFRLFRLRAIMPKSLEYEKLTILDYYLQFPFRINEMRLFQRHSYLRKLAVKYESSKPYGNLPDSHVLFGRMKPIQSAAFQSMVAAGYYSKDAYDRGLAVSTDKPMPIGIAARVKILNDEQSDLMEGLLTIADEYDLTGSDGLKARSGLLEHRYDAV